MPQFNLGRVKGEKGDKGDTGEKGDTGLQGIQGIQGIQGATGLAGDKGEPGDTGARGLTGAASTIPGPKGDKGEKGDKGDTGAKGTSAIIDSVSVNTGLAGTEASVLLGGTSTNRNFDFTIPRGDKGEKGDTGQILNFYSATTLDTPNVVIDSDGNYKRSNDPLNAASRKVGTAAGNLVERDAKGYPSNNNALGVGQTWQDMTASRLSGVTYTNTTGRPIEVFLSMPNSASRAYYYINGWQFVGNSIGTRGGYGSATFTVPHGDTYGNTSGAQITTWLELR